MTELVPLPTGIEPFLAEYLPSETHTDNLFVTLTYAQSLDSRISAAPGQRTVISHVETKTMTHYLRSKHDAILVGCGTAIADDPKLNCRYNQHMIRPVVIDPGMKWDVVNSKVMELALSQQALAPWVLTAGNIDPVVKDKLEKAGGLVIQLGASTFDWKVVFHSLKEHGIKSVMVEGGASVINQLYNTNLVDSLVITIGPVLLGDKGTMVSPRQNVTPFQVKWWSGIQDSVMAARLR